jgi:chemotaxis signal transduction protein
MVGPLDPNSPDQDHGSAPASPDSDLHALLERLLGQGDIRAGSSGAADELWPELKTTSAVADEVSTIVPAPEAPAVVVQPSTPMITFADASDVESSEPPPARRWEAVVVDSPAESTNLDDIHAAILAKVTVGLEPIAPAVPEAAVEPVAPEPVVADKAAVSTPETVEVQADFSAVEPVAIEPSVFEPPAFTPSVEPPPIAAFDASLFESDPAQPSFEKALDAAALALAGFEPSMFEPAAEAAVEPAVEVTSIAPVADEPVADEPAQVETLGSAPVAAEPVADVAAAVEPAPFESELFAPTAVDTAALDSDAAELLAYVSAFGLTASEPMAEPVTSEPAAPMAFEAETEPADVPAVPSSETDGSTPFALTPFEAPAEPPVSADADGDADALWAAAVPELGLDIAPALDLDGDDEADVEPVAPTAVVLPWPTADAKPLELVAVDTLDDAEPVDPTASEPQDLIEAALAGLQGDLTAEPVEPLRTPEVAAATAHVIFRLGTRMMAIPLAAVSEIARPPKTTRLPHVPAWVLGIANLRGDIVSMLDLEGFFSGKVGRSTHEQRMLALRPAGDEVRTAVLVDSVDGIQALEDARVARVTRGYDAEVAPFARGLYQMEGNLVVVLDAERLLQSKPMRQFEDGASAR